MLFFYPMVVFFGLIGVFLIMSFLYIKSSALAFKKGVFLLSINFTLKRQLLLNLCYIFILVFCSCIYIIFFLKEKDVYFLITYSIVLFSVLPILIVISSINIFKALKWINFFSKKYENIIKLDFSDFKNVKLDEYDFNLNNLTVQWGRKKINFNQIESYISKWKNIVTKKFFLRRLWINILLFSAIQKSFEFDSLKDQVCFITKKFIDFALTKFPDLTMEDLEQSFEKYMSKKTNDKSF